MLEIRHITKRKLQGDVILPVSKSMSNRYLLMQALAGKTSYHVGDEASNDEKLLQKALEVHHGHVDFEDAGTPMRLYIAYAALLGLDVIIDGTERLRSRPIGPLLDALEQLGAEFEFHVEQDSLPLNIRKGVDRHMTSVELSAELSSQFLSALLLIAPYFHQGLQITTTGTTASESYIAMTIDVMRKAGIPVLEDREIYRVEPGSYNMDGSFEPEKDWSSATFIYAMAAVSDAAEIFMPGLRLDSVQGDRMTAEVFQKLGVMTEEQPDGIMIRKVHQAAKSLEMDFSTVPDMFPAVCAVCAALNMPAVFTGVKNLAYKESNRIEAMRFNVGHAGIELVMKGDDELLLKPNMSTTEGPCVFRSFNDHRIVMACSIFAMKKDISIDDETVVKKSFPDYWQVFGQLTGG